MGNFRHMTESDWHAFRATLAFSGIAKHSEAWSDLRAHLERWAYRRALLAPTRDGVLKTVLEDGGATRYRSGGATRWRGVYIRMGSGT